MNIDNYIMFIGVSVLLCISPGPDMMFILGRSIAHGRRAGLAAVLGITLGNYTHLTAAVLGLTALLATSPLAFAAVKWCGALYLVFLGIQMMRAGSIISSIPSQLQSTAVQQSDSLQQSSFRSIVLQGFLNDVLNPKVAIFYIMLLPQFIEVKDAQYLQHLLLLGVTLNMIGLIVSLTLVFIAAWLTRSLRDNAAVANRMNTLLGALFVGMGIWLAC
jgi:threonine/homoserine/homoserine lactone efflux protein